MTTPSDGRGRCRLSPATAHSDAGSGRFFFLDRRAPAPNRPTGTSIDLAAWDSLADDPDRLIEALNGLLLHGAMSNEMRDAIRAVVDGIPAANARARVRNAIYLIATSSQYHVQR